MRKTSDSPPALQCIRCGTTRETDEERGKVYEMAGQLVYLCHEHAETFELGLQWQTKEYRFKQERIRKEMEDTQQQLKQPQSVQSQQIAQMNEQRRQQDAQEQAMQERRERVERRMSRIFNFDDTPQEIFDDLSRWVVGQDAAKRTLASAVRNHYKRVQMRMIEESGKSPAVSPDLLAKESVLLLGPTGCGKSHVCRSVSRIVDVPFWKDAMAKYTEDGYVGNSADELLSSLISISDGYIPLAEKGMLFLDEVDKKAKRNVSGSRDVSGEGLQVALLEMLDTGGSKVFVCPFVAGRRNPNQPLVEFDTVDVMFFLGGAFVGLADIISNRVGNRARRMGFGSSGEDGPIDTKLRESELLHQVQPEDIIQFGFVPELMGRIGSIAVFDPLTIEELKMIMLNIDDAVVKQQQARARVEGFNLEVAEEAVDLICKQAYDSGMGARRLRSLTSEILTPMFFEVPSRVRRRSRKPKVTITAETVLDPTKYQFK